MEIKTGHVADNKRDWHKRNLNWVISVAQPDGNGVQFGAHTKGTRKSHKEITVYGEKKFKYSFG